MIQFRYLRNGPFFTYSPDILESLNVNFNPITLGFFFYCKVISLTSTVIELTLISFGLGSPKMNLAPKAALHFELPRSQILFMILQT